MKRIILFSIVLLAIFGVTNGCALKKPASFIEPPTAPPSSIKTPTNRPNEGALIEPSVTLLFDFGDDTIEQNYELRITNYEEGETVWQIMQQALTENEIALEYDDYGGELGILITKIGDKKNGEDGRYWQYWINGKYAKVGVSNYLMKAGDVVEWKFTDNKLKSEN